MSNVTERADSTFFAANNATLAQQSQSGVDASVILKYAEYAVIPGKVLYSTGLTNGSFGTFTDRNLTITKFNESTYVNDAKIIWSDLLVSNGVLHVVDKVRGPS